MNARLHHVPNPVRANARGVSRRSLLAGLGAAALGVGQPLAAWAADAVDWPRQAITLIVPWPPGGGTDLTLRIMAEEASVRLGQPIIVLNKPGAAGTLVAPALKNARPDGYTIGQLPVTVLRSFLKNDVPWDPIRDLAPIVRVSGTTFGLLVPANSRFKTFAELIDWARQHPSELLMGSTGVGTTAHLAMEEVMLDQGIPYTHVPYKGTADQMLALASGELMAGVNSTGFGPWVDDGRLRLLVVFSAQRSERWPNVPTMKELGYPQSVYTSPWGLVAPAGTPPAVIQKLHDAFAPTLKSPRVLTELARYDQEPAYLNAADYGASIAADLARERALLKRMNLLSSPK